jgi:hypothetical protein
MLNSGYKQKAYHNFCSSPGQIHHDTKLIVRLPISETGPDSYREAKIAPWCLARRDSFVAKVPGPYPA